MKSMPRAVQVYITLVTLVAVILSLMSLQALFAQSSAFLACLTFALLILIADLYPIHLPSEDNAEVTVSCAFKTALVIIFGPAVAVPATLLGTLLAEFTLKRPWYAAMFNAAEMTITAASMSFVYEALQDGSRAPFNSLQNAAAVGAVVLTYAIVNTGLVTLVMAFWRGVNFLHVWKANFREAMWNNLTIIPTGAVLAALWLEHPWSVLFLILPIIVVRKSFEFIGELKRQTEETLIRMADAIDQRDPSTFQHSQRVAQYAEAIAREMGLTAEDIEVIRSAARLHDLGKIGMSNTLLFKPGRFDEAERAEFQRHPAIGYDLVDRFRLFKEGRQLILAHHERYDGKGYPRGLKGEEIPLGGRIIAVADSFDAMTSQRSYNNPLTTEAALNELLANKGTQFDPQVVDAFVRVMTGKRQDVRWPEGVIRSSEIVP